MSEKSISIIVMRDRGKSFSLRFSPNTFKVFVSVLVLVPLFLAGSVWFGLTYYTKYVSVLEESAVLKNTIEQNRQTVTRLANLEQFLQKYSPSMLGLLVPSEEVDINNLPVPESDKEAMMNELVGNLAGTSMSFDIVGSKEDSAVNNNFAAAGENAAQDEKSADTAAKENKDGVKENTEQSAEGREGKGSEIHSADQRENEPAQIPQAAQEVSAKVLQKIDLGYLKIENFTAKVVAKNVQITYRLLNAGKKVPLQGEQKYYLCSEINGKIVRQELKNPTDDSFRIKNLKNVQSTASLMGLEIGKKARFIVEVAVDGEIVYRQPYPLTR